MSARTSSRDCANLQSCPNCTSRPRALTANRVRQDGPTIVQVRPTTSASSANHSGSSEPALRTEVQPPGGFDRFESMVARIPITNVSPVLEHGRYPVKAVPGEALTVAGERVPRGPRPARRGRRTDRLPGQGPAAGPDDRAGVPGPVRGEVAPDSEGAWTYRIESWSDPYGTWKHNAEIKIAAEIDVQLMFTEGDLLFKRAIKNIPPAHPRARPRATTLTSAAAAGRDKKLPVPVRLAALTSPEVGRRPASLPAPRPRVDRRALPDLRRPRAGALRLLVRVLPAQRGCDVRRQDARVEDRHLHHGQRAPPRRRRHGLRHHLPSADPPDRGRSTARVPTTP